MKTKKLHLLVLVICFAVKSLSQSPAKTDAVNAADTATVNSLVQKRQSKPWVITDTAILLAEQAKNLAEKNKFPNWESPGL
jgi:hypothetical protein